MSVTLRSESGCSVQPLSHLINSSWHRREGWWRGIAWENNGGIHLTCIRKGWGNVLVRNFEDLHNQDTENLDPSRIFSWDKLV